MISAVYHSLPSKHMGIWDGTMRHKKTIKQNWWMYITNFRPGSSQLCSAGCAEESQAMQSPAGHQGQAPEAGWFLGQKWSKSREFNHQQLSKSGVWPANIIKDVTVFSPQSSTRQHMGLTIKHYQIGGFNHQKNSKSGV